MTEGLHSECAGDVHITAVFPGAVATNITANSGVTIPIDDATAAAQTRKTTTPERAARDILDGMENNAYRVLIGRDAKLMDILYRLTPRRSARLIADRMKDLLGR